MNDHHLLETIARRTDAIRDTVNYNAHEITDIRRELAALKRDLSPNHCRPAMRLVTGIVFKVQSGEIVMSGSSGPITLTNAANAALATRYLGVIDITNGSALPAPTVTNGNAALVNIVAAAALNASNQFVFGVYPVDTAAETNDPVEVTLVLPGDASPVVLDFAISGTPVPPPEGETLDASSAVGSWAGAPNVPATPV